MAQYDTARAHYGEKLRVILEEDVPNHEPPAETRELDASPVVPEAAAAESAAVPFGGSSSASGPDATTEADAAERDRQRLHAEVSSWDLKVSPKEIEFIIQHQPYSKARQLLWQARRPAAEPLTAAAAD
jgi:hypothetical protein